MVPFICINTDKHRFDLEIVGRERNRDDEETVCGAHRWGRCSVVAGIICGRKESWTDRRDGGRFEKWCRLPWCGPAVPVELHQDVVVLLMAPAWP
jgi:hypothetical protein